VTFFSIVLWAFPFVYYEASSEPENDSGSKDRRGKAAAWVPSCPRIRSQSLSDHDRPSPTVRDEPLQQPSALGGRSLDCVAEHVVVVIRFAQAVGQLGDEARPARAVVPVHSLWFCRDTQA
jgi:hypothetical protein